MSGLFPDAGGPKARPAIVTAILAALIASAASMIVVPNPRGLFGCALAMLAVAIAVVDARRYIIPDSLTLSVFALGLLHAFVFDDDPALEALALAVLRAGLTSLTFFALRTGYARVRKRSGIGLGDVKLAAGVGAWLDWTAIAVAIEAAALAALIVVLVRFLRGHRVTAATAVPFGLFLAPSIWIGWIFEAIFLRSI